VDALFPARPPFGEVSHIVVLRPSAIGDFVFALPALFALRAAYPEARLTLLGRAWHKELLAGRPGPIDAVRVMPPVRGVGAPVDVQEDAAQIDAFVSELNASGVDLAIQLYGGGAYSNPFLLRISARHHLGMRAPGAPALPRELPYVTLQNERLRLLEVAALAGATAAPLDPRLTLMPRDLAEAARALGVDDRMRWVVVQPGASDPRRRWPAERFAAVADALADAGARVAVNGSAEERALVQSVRAAMRHPALDLATADLSLSGLVGVLARAALLVSNDTGPLHLAQTVGTPSVGVYWFSNLLVSAPLIVARHRHLVALRPDCPVCGSDNVSGRCAHDVSFVSEVSVDAVRDAALALWADELASSSSAASSTA
jgi:ADP-heptose:LPS heptosyltransferase